MSNISINMPNIGGFAAEKYFGSFPEFPPQRETLVFG